MTSPYPGYIISFFIAVAVYSLGWSDVYPDLDLPLILFLIATMVLFVILSYYWKRSDVRDESVTSATINPSYVTIFIYALWSLDFLYEGGIPLLKILFNQPYDYRLFGFPTVHVFTVTFASFYTVYLFQLFIETRERMYFILYGVNLLAALLIYSRAMLFFNLAGSVFVYFSYAQSISVRKVLLTIPVLVVLLYFFGVLGNLRTSFEAHERYNSSRFMDIGYASKGFRESAVPKEYFWPFIYISSPLANLQNNITHYKHPDLTATRFAEFINNEILMDAISKRVNVLIGKDRLPEYRIAWPFNVSTIYSRSYAYYGWYGMILMAIAIGAIPFLYRWILPRGCQYNRTALAILCTMYLFMVYDNTIRFTGLAFQLVYPFALCFIDHKILKRFT